ncbi:hypothetical protein [Rahnella laticis]|uniref:hypothetical protein n=1 Tax=Rahnella laticis TaxID=2787622 RepID=UPI0018A2EAC9|nr:hypothetical protein [Rahnella laticis]MBF7997455.1 hypothetical protein [Rahnella laticis]
MSHNKRLYTVLKGALKMVLFTVASVWNFFESVLFVGGLIGCLMLPVAWPMKFVYAAVWLIFFFSVSKGIAKLEDNQERSRNSKLRK